MTDVGSRAGSPTGSPPDTSPLRSAASRDLAEIKPRETPAAKIPSSTSAEAVNLQLQAELAGYRESQARMEELAATRESELMARLSHFQEMFELAQRNASQPGSVPTIPIVQAEAVLQEREAAFKREVEQEILRKDAHLEAVQAEARRLAAGEAEGRAKSLELETRMRAVQEEWDLHQGTLKREVEAQKATAQLTQRSLQETQGVAHEQAVQMGTEMQRARFENQALQAQLQQLQLQMSNAQLHGQVPGSTPLPSYLPPRADDAQSVMIEAIRRMQKSSTGPSQFSKLAKFDSTKTAGESATLWINRVGVAIKEEDWSNQVDVDILGKIGHLLDDPCFQWVSSLPLEDRSASAWPTFTKKWKARFGLSREVAMHNLCGRFQKEGENARAYGESVKNLCLSADINFNSFENTNRLIAGFTASVRRQVKIEFGAMEDKTFEEILTRAVDLEKVFSSTRCSPDGIPLHRGVQEATRKGADPRLWF